MCPAECPGALPQTVGAGVPQCPALPGGGALGRGTTPACTRTPDRSRVLPGRHLDGCEDPGQCVGCLPCPEQHCQTCRREHAEHTCPSCLAQGRANLGQLGELYVHLPAQARFGRQAYHTHEHIPGGDATVMLTPASVSWQAGHVGRVTVELPGDPRPPLDVLTYWANLWQAHTHGEPQHHPSMTGVVTYLDRQLHHIGASSLFTYLAHDLALTLHQMENVLHAGTRPEVSRVPCLDCHARLVKVYADEARHDHWRCPVCAQVYDRGRYERAQHDHLVSRGADRFVPLTDAVAATGRPEATVRAWVRDGLVEVRRSGGRVLVWWPSVRDKHQATPTRRRAAG